MKKAMVSILVFLIIVILSFSTNHCENKKVERKTAEYEAEKYAAREEERRAEEYAAKMALDERLKKYFTIREIRDAISKLEANMTTEMIIEKNPKKQYFDNLRKHSNSLYVKILDIKPENGHRRISVEWDTIAAGATGLRKELDFHSYSVTYGSVIYDFVIYDDNRMLSDISIGDKVDIEVIGTNEVTQNYPYSFGEIKIIEKRTILYFSVIKMENNWGQNGASGDERLRT